MNPDRMRLQYLFGQYFGKTASAEERTELTGLINNEANQEEVMQLFTAAWEKYQGDGMIIPAERTDEILQTILGKNKDSATVREISPARRIQWGRIAAAAVIVLFLGSGAYFWLANKKTNDQPVTKVKEPQVQDFLPGGNKAVLTIAGGQRIILDSAANGQLTIQGNAQVTKTANGKLAYSSMGNTRGSIVIYNTLSTPRGGQYQLTLPDGTQVWLNAASSITYPTAFIGKERNVTITGEAYFEVVHNDKMPFKVKAANQLIEDIGTHFNVNAYADEPVMKTTLIEGAIMVKLSTPSGEGQGMRLKPGQQAQVTATEMTFFPHASIPEAIAWKTGFFSFSGADVQTVMRQIARWYDVEVSYEGGISKDKFTGEIDRNITLTKVLDNLARSRVHFRIEGKKLILTP